MKKDFKLLFMSLAMAGLMTSCFSEEHEFGLPTKQDEGKGTLILNLNADAEFSNTTRALNENNYKATANYNVKIVNTKNENVVLDCKGSELSDNLPKTLDIASYRIEASYGTESAASRSDFKMYGESTFTIKAKDEKTVTVNCTPTCGKVSVAFDAAMATYYDDYSVSFGGTKALGSNTFAWAKNDSEPWYVALDVNGETINYTISLTAKEEYLHKDGENTSATGTATGSFKLERNKAQKLTIKPNYTPSVNGGLKISITIDKSTNDKEVTYDIPVTWI